MSKREEYRSANISNQAQSTSRLELTQVLKKYEGETRKCCAKRPCFWVEEFVWFVGISCTEVGCQLCVVHIGLPLRAQCHGVLRSQGFLRSVTDCFCVCGCFRHLHWENCMSILKGQRPEIWASSYTKRSKVMFGWTGFSKLDLRNVACNFSFTTLTSVCMQMNKTYAIKPPNYQRMGGQR